MGKTKEAAPLVPAFGFGGPNESVFVADDEASMLDSSGQVLLTGEARVSLDLLPTPGIRIYVTNRDVFADVREGQALELARHKRRIEGFPVVANRSSREGTRVVWVPHSTPIIGVGNADTAISEVVFHLFGFEDVIGTSGSIERRGSAMYAIEHLLLAAGSWIVELRSLVETREHIKQLRNEGGCGLTHVGRVRRPDGSAFMGKDAMEALNVLRLFFSFAKGAWCEPVCAVGRDSTGERVWESWSSPRASWQSPASWFDPHHGSQLAELFPAFMSRLMEDDWRRTFHEVIYWYLNANLSSRGIDAGIILTQAALERLAFEHATKMGHLGSKEKHTRGTAADRVRQMLSHLKIPLDIPSVTPELQRLAGSNQLDWCDSPHALTAVRNSLVHPDSRWRGQLASAYPEAWKLGLWYVEMSILAICGYSGTYGNRLRQRWVGQVEDVPWTQ